MTPSTWPRDSTFVSRDNYDNPAALGESRLICMSHQVKRLFEFKKKIEVAPECPGTSSGSNKRRRMNEIFIEILNKLSLLEGQEWKLMICFFILVSRRHNGRRRLEHCLRVRPGQIANSGMNGLPQDPRK